MTSIPYSDMDHNQVTWYSEAEDNVFDTVESEYSDDDCFSDASEVETDHSSLLITDPEDQKLGWSEEVAPENGVNVCTTEFIDWSGNAWDSESQVQPDLVLTQNTDWETEKEQCELYAQQRCNSLILRRLAHLEIPMLSAESALVPLEGRAGQKVSKQRAAFLANRRRQRTILVDTTAKLRPLLDRLAVLDHSEPKVMIDCEGLNFKRTGTIDIMELFVTPEDKLYLIDIIALKGSAWETSSTIHPHFSLSIFLTSSVHKKVMWDLRMDAHILNKIFGIRFSGILDASLWAVAKRRANNPWYDGFRNSIETACSENISHMIDAGELKSLHEAKEQRGRLPPRPWAIRPLPETLIDYAADVKYMGMLYRRFKNSLGGNEALVRQIEIYTEEDLSVACDWMWEATKEREAVSPWTPGYSESLKEGMEWRTEQIALQTTFHARMKRFFTVLLPTALKDDGKLLLSVGGLIGH